MVELGLSVAEQWQAVEQIKRLFAARLRAMDNKRWDLYPGFHTEDVVSESWGGLPEDKQPRSESGEGRAVGTAKLTAAISGMLDGAVKLTTVHHAHTPEIELTSDTTATGIWAMEDELWWTNAAGGEEHLHGYGHYHEEYRKVNGQWLISYRKLTRLREDHTPAFYDFLTPL